MNISLSQVLKYLLSQEAKEDLEEVEEVVWLESTDGLMYHNQATMEITDSQLSMLSMEVESSPTQIKVLVNGGKLHLVEGNTKLVLSESEIEEIAAVKDLPKLEFLLEANFVDHYQVKQEMDNGIKLLATTANLLLEVKLNWLLFKIHTFQLLVLKFSEFICKKV